MKYTLDSQKQVETALIEKFKTDKINFEQVILSGSEMDFTQNERKAYFGLLTVHADCVVTVFNNDDEIMIVEGGNQVILYFTHAIFKDIEGVVITPKGQFRGSAIQI